MESVTHGITLPLLITRVVGSVGAQAKQTQIGRIEMFRGMNNVQIGEELWARAGDMNIAEAVRAYGGEAEAASAAVEVIADAEDYDEISDVAGDPARCIREYLERETL